MRAKSLQMIVAPVLRRAACVALGTLLAALATAAPAQDTLKVAIEPAGRWASDGVRIGQRAGIFKKHGLVLDIVDTSGGGETLQAVISGSADLGIGIATAPVLRAYAKGAPIRVIGANFTGAGDLYWYVRADSPLERLDDAHDKTTIAYAASGSPSHNVVLAFLRDLGIKALPTATGTQPATLNLVMSGQIDVGWGAAPSGLKELTAGKIRIIATGNDVPSLRTQTVRVDVVNAEILERRRDAVLRFVRAYRETLHWMFSSPEAVRMHAEQINVPVELAAMTRDRFQTRKAMRNDRLSDIDAVMTEAVMLKFLDRPLSPEQLADLIQIPAL
jgi:NitT/TauT family transport system substrate-binding protein